MLVTFYTNSFNRKALLVNLLRSFEACNEHPRVEWVITDYGSQDGSREFLTDYAKNASFPVKLIIADEQQYFDSLGLPTLDRRTRFEAILRKYRNDALAAAEGEFVFDVATDHQFIRRGNWIDEIRAIHEHRRQQRGTDDIATIIPFGYFRWRLDKENNRRGQEQNADGTAYFVAREKSYVDYGVMNRAVINAIGPYMELTEIGHDPSRIERWYTKDPLLHPESEYARRCQAQGLKRIFMKYPILITFHNQDVTRLAESAGDNLIIPLWTKEKMETIFNRLDRPVSSDELSRPVTSFLISKSTMLWQALRA